MQKNVIGNAENVIGNAEQCNRKCRKCNRKCRKMEQEMQKNVIGNAEKCNGDKPFNGTAMNKMVSFTQQSVLLLLGRYLYWWTIGY